MANVYTDASWNARGGAWAVVCGEREETGRCVEARNSTTAELEALAAAAEWAARNLSGSVTVWSDCRHAVRLAQDPALKSGSAPVSALRRRVAAARRRLPGSITFEWTPRGTNRIRRCDAIAGEARKRKRRAA
jgi:ribonuclease HI